VYGQVVSLVLALPQRWPKLSQLVLEHRWLFLNWRTLLPSVLTLVLTAVNSAVYYLLLPQATLTPRDLSGHFFLAGLLSVLAAVVVLLDGYALSIRGDIRTPELDKQLDQAEFWLRAGGRMWWNGSPYAVFAPADGGGASPQCPRSCRRNDQLGHVVLGSPIAGARVARGGFVVHLVLADAALTEKDGRSACLAVSRPVSASWSVTVALLESDGAAFCTGNAGQLLFSPG
jgi:hypothetical protein